MKYQIYRLTTELNKEILKTFNTREEAGQYLSKLFDNYKWQGIISITLAKL